MNRLPAMNLKSALCVILLVSAIGLGACARQKAPVVKPLKTTILIMDFDVPAEYAEEGKTVKPGGWWFGAYKSYRNPNAGKQFAEILTEKLRADSGEWASLFDRLRLRQYFAKKRVLLVNQYPSLAEEEIDQLMEQVPTAAFARELGADKILVGEIDSYMKVNSASRFWRSNVDLRASLIDVDSGTVLWQYDDNESDMLGSEMAVFEKLAERMIDDMQSRYFFKPMHDR